MDTCYEKNFDWDLSQQVPPETNDSQASPLGGRGEQVAAYRLDKEVACAPRSTVSRQGLSQQGCKMQRTAQLAAVCNASEWD